MLAPFAVIFVVFTAYPLAQSLVLSLQQTFGPSASRWVGLRNYEFLLRDPLFWKALRNTALYAAGSLFIQLPIALGLALLLERPSIRGRGALRLVLFSPSLVGVAFAAMIFGVILEKRTGLLNLSLHALTSRLPTPWSLDFPWLQQQVMWALIVASLWMFVGFNMTYFSAALQNVRRELIEAATLDGASPWQRFLHVVVPEILPVGGFVVLLSLIGSFQLFELPYLLLAGAGPDNRGLTIVLYLYQTGFDSGDLGYASAIGWVLTLILAVAAIAQRRLVHKGEAT
jgi:ABC-type sugar transport system permease subunit